MLQFKMAFFLLLCVTQKGQIFKTVFGKQQESFALKANIQPLKAFRPYERVHFLAHTTLQLGMFVHSTLSMGSNPLDLARKVEYPARDSPQVVSSLDLLCTLEVTFR